MISLILALTALMTSRGFSPYRIKTTPLRSHRVAPGRHQVVLQNPEAGLERRFEIEIEPGESKRLSVDLRGNP